ncbi:MAG: alpha/beta fold hydrolase [Mycobacterium sp.]
MMMDEQVRFCTTHDGVRIAYATSGTGRPLVRVLGWLSHLGFDSTGPFWAPWVKALGHQFQLVRYDGRGIGLSDREVSDFSVEAKVRDLEAVVEALGPAPCVLLGMSEGAATAIAYAVRHPERVARLVLLGGTAYIARTPDHAERSLAYQTLIRQLWGNDGLSVQQFFSVMQFPDAGAAFYAWHVALQRASATPETAARFLAAYLDVDIRVLLPAVTVPTLVLHRREDALVPLEAGRELGAGIPGAQFRVFAGRNHLPLPREPVLAEMLAAVVQFVSATPAALATTPPAAFTPVLRALSQVSPYPAGLTAREVQVLRLLAGGQRNPDIATTLVLSVKTVERHLANVYGKIGARSRVEASIYALRHGLVDAVLTG